MLLLLKTLQWPSQIKQQKIASTSFFSGGKTRSFSARDSDFDAI
jgi:hypothetical protein